MIDLELTPIQAEIVRYVLTKFREHYESILELIKDNTFYELLQLIVSELKIVDKRLIERGVHNVDIFKDIKF